MESPDENLPLKPNRPDRGERLINQDQDIGLCCCEYVNTDGERSHLLALCCDCEAVDQAADRLLSGQGLADSSVGDIITVAEDRLRLPFKGGALKVPLGKILPLQILPFFLYISSLHPLLLLLSSLFLPLIFFAALRILFKHRPQTQFFLYWSYSSAGCLIYLYEVKLVGLFWDLPKIISWWENLTLVVLALASIEVYRRLRNQAARARKSSGEGKKCRICERRVEGKDHHCIWLGLCVSEANKRTFLLLLFLLFLAASHLSLLLTSAACPSITLIGPILLPKVCWPYESNSRLLLVGGLYSGVVAILVALLLLEQISRKCRKRIIALRLSTFY